MLRPKLVRKPSPVENAAPEMPSHAPIVSGSAGNSSPVFGLNT